MRRAGVRKFGYHRNALAGRNRVARICIRGSSTLRRMLLEYYPHSSIRTYGLSFDAAPSIGPLSRDGRREGRLIRSRPAISAPLTGCD